jgi:DNA modification methylase
MMKKLNLSISGLSYVLHNGDFSRKLRDIRGVDLFLLSPPYNIGSDSPKKLTNRKFGGFDAKSFGGIEEYPDRKDEQTYQAEQTKALRFMAERLSPHGQIIYNHKERRKHGELIQPETWFPWDVLSLKEKIIWDRGSTHNHCPSYTYDQHEILYCLVLRDGAKPYFKMQKALWETRSHIRGIGNVWSIPKESSEHNAPMPLVLAKQIIRLYCPPNGLVCDTYSGSGTTMLACLIEGRNFIGAELEEKYFTMSIERLRYEANTTKCA